MKYRKLVLPFFVCVLGSALSLGSLAKETPKAATSSTSAAAQAPPSEEEKPIDFEPIPWENADFKAPTAAAWVNAVRVKVERRGPRAERCRVWRTKNWLKVHCDVQTTAIGLVGGTSQGVSMWMPEPKEGVPSPDAGEVIFPIRPGDRHIFELFSYGETYGGSMVSPGILVQEYWLEGERAPTILLY